MKTLLRHWKEEYSLNLSCSLKNIIMHRSGNHGGQYYMWLKHSTYKGRGTINSQQNEKNLTIKRVEIQDIFFNTYELELLICTEKVSYDTRLTKNDNHVLLFLFTMLIFTNSYSRVAALFSSNNFATYGDLGMIY